MTMTIFFNVRFSDTEVRRGWEREPVPEGFLEIMTTYILKHWTNIRKARPKSPVGKKRGWLDILSKHLGTRREGYFAYLADKCGDAHEMITKRYAEKVKFYEMNNVSPEISPN